jgi:MSHA biogenesis protein MshN
MSVINQMLKDLEQRSPEPNANSTQSGKVVEAHSPRKIVVVTSICVLTVCFIGFYIWQLISENNALKSQQITNSMSVVGTVSVRNKSADINSSAITPKKVNDNENKVIKSPISQEVAKIEVKQQTSTVSVENTPPNKTQYVPSNKSLEKITQVLSAKPLLDNSNSKITPAKKAVALADEHTHSAGSPSHEYTLSSAVKPKPKANRMSVSRRQLSADELAEQKLVLVEKALDAKQIEKAEKLLEDVVIIRPSDSQTRKKLAALWFGREAYQDAVNLLSQGISLNSKDSSLRQMKARIHLKQGQFTAALNTLKPLAQLKDEQYQIMLANTAQQAKQNKIAVGAYKVLIAMKPDIGRWQLGLAVLYDKNSQFELASMTYKKALTKNDLSTSSENFIKQRIQVIGQ